MSHLPGCLHPQRGYPCDWCQEFECECPCICDRLRACEKRTLHAARQAIGMLKPSMWRRNEEGAVVQESVWRDDALAAIDALGTQPAEPTARRSLAYDPAAKDNRP